MQLKAPDYVILIVEELDRALAFYTEVLGLRLVHRSGDYAQLDTGVTRLALYTRSAMSKILAKPLDMPNASAPGFEIGFKVADVDAAFSELVARGGRSVVPPTDRFWGQRTAYIRDPDGHLIELAQDLRGRWASRQVGSKLEPPCGKLPIMVGAHRRGGNLSRRDCPLAKTAVAGWRY